jgi:hypothetical protein
MLVRGWSEREFDSDVAGGGVHGGGRGAVGELGCALALAFGSR